MCIYMYVESGREMWVISGGCSPVATLLGNGNSEVASLGLGLMVRSQRLGAGAELYCVGYFLALNEVKRFRKIRG